LAKRGVLTDKEEIIFTRLIQRTIWKEQPKIGSKRERHQKKLASDQDPDSMQLVNVPCTDGRLTQIYAPVGKRWIVQRTRRRLAVGVWQHPQTHLWQVGYSISGSDITWVAAYRDPKEANQRSEEIKLADAQSNLSPNFFSRLMQRMTALPEKMSLEEIAQVLASIPPET